MSELISDDAHGAQYEIALKHFKHGDVSASIEAAKLNLKLAFTALIYSTKRFANSSRDYSLPLHYIIKNAVLVASTIRDWDEAEIWRLTAEQAYSTSYGIALKNNNKKALLILEDLRDELDELEEYMLEGMATLADDEMYGGSMDSDGGEEDVGDVEDNDESAIGLHDEVHHAAAVDHEFDFPIRTTGERPDTSPARSATSSQMIHDIRGLSLDESQVQ